MIRRLVFPKIKIKSELVAVNTPIEREKCLGQVVKQYIGKTMMS